MRTLLLIALLLGACAEKGTVGQCDELCGILVDDCGYSAFPSHDSCNQGCMYEEENGMNVGGYLDCVNDVGECDTYGIVECDNEYGA